MKVDFRFMLDLVFIPWEWFGHTMCKRKEFHELFLARLSRWVVVPFAEMGKLGNDWV